MDAKRALHMLRHGEGDIWEVIRYYSGNHLERELVDYLNDHEMRSSVLYVLSELPSVDEVIRERIRSSIADNMFSGPDLEWAKDIIGRG